MKTALDWPLFWGRVNGVKVQVLVVGFNLSMVSEGALSPLMM